MAVTLEQIAKIDQDFTAIVDDILPLIPHSPTVDIVEMMIKTAKGALMTLLHQHVSTGPTA